MESACEHEFRGENQRQVVDVDGYGAVLVTLFETLRITSLKPAHHAHMAKRGANFVSSILFLGHFNYAWQIGLQCPELAELLKGIERHQNKVDETRFCCLPDSVDAPHRSSEH